MYRVLQVSAALGVTLLLAGCCYKPCAYDPITGVMYGGGLEPCCCGPLDPFCLFCNGCEQPLQPSCAPTGCGGCFSGCGGWAAPSGNCCQTGLNGGLHCGPHAMLPAPAYGGVIPPGAHLDGGMIYGGTVVDGGTIIHQDGMIETTPQAAPQPAQAPTNSANQSSPPPAPPAEADTGAIVPWPMAPPSARQQPAAQPARFQSYNGRWIPAHR